MAHLIEQSDLVGFLLELIQPGLELVVGFDQRRFGALLLGDVAGDGRRGDDPAVGIAHRRDGQ